MSSPAGSLPSGPSSTLKIEELRELKLPSGVLGFDLSPNAKDFMAGCLDGGVYRVEADTGRWTLLSRHESYASSAHFIPHGHILISGGYDGMLHWHDLREQTVRKVRAHRFWSWQLAVSNDGTRVASTTGQYLCGGPKYEPATETEPSVKVFDAHTGAVLQSLSHVPPVQSVAFSPDNRWLAAGNLMGEVRVWEVQTGKQVAAWTTPSFTGWGVIKGHYYTGGIYAILFTPNAEHLLLTGMGSTTDPAAGNGKQLWQRYAWREDPPKKVSETKEDDSGRGLMEALAFHPSSKFFLMAGRLFNGKWNTALFDAANGSLLYSLDAKMRVTRALFSADGTRLFLAGAIDQGKKKDDKLPESGRIKIYRVDS